MEAQLLDFKKIKEAKDGGVKISEDNWLWNMKEGTQFLCRQTNVSGGSDDLEFHLLDKRYFEDTGKFSVRLVSMLNEDLQFWKNPVRFVNQFELVGILDAGNKINEK